MLADCEWLFVPRLRFRYRLAPHRTGGGFVGSTTWIAYIAAVADDFEEGDGSGGEAVGNKRIIWEMSQDI